MFKSVDMPFLDFLFNFNTFGIFEEKNREANFESLYKLWDVLSKTDANILEIFLLEENQSIKDRNDKIVKCFHKFIDELFEKMEIDCKSNPECGGIKGKSLGEFFKNFNDKTKNWNIAKEGSEYKEEFEVIKGIISLLKNQILNEKFIKELKIFLNEEFIEELKKIVGNDAIGSIKFIPEILECLTDENKMDQIKFGSNIIEFAVNKMLGSPILAKIASYISPIISPIINLIYPIEINQNLNKYIKLCFPEYPNILKKALILSSQLSTNSDFKLIDLMAFLNRLNSKELIAKLKTLDFDKIIIIDDKGATKDNIQTRIDQFQDFIEKADAFKALFKELSLRMKIPIENGGLKGISIQEFIEKFEEKTHDWESRKVYTEILGQKEVDEFCAMIKLAFSSLTAKQKRDQMISLSDINIITELKFGGKVIDNREKLLHLIKSLKEQRSKIKNFHPEIYGILNLLGLKKDNAKQISENIEGEKFQNILNVVEWIVNNKEIQDVLISGAEKIFNDYAKFLDVNYDSDEIINGVTKYSDKEKERKKELISKLNRLWMKQCEEGFVKKEFSFLQIVLNIINSLKDRILRFFKNEPLQKIVSNPELNSFDNQISEKYKKLNEKYKKFEDGLTNFFYNKNQDVIGKEFIKDFIERSVKVKGDFLVKATIETKTDKKVEEKN